MTGRDKGLSLTDKIRLTREVLLVEYLEVLIFVKAISDKVGQAKIQHPPRIPIVGARKYKNLQNCNRLRPFWLKIFEQPVNAHLHGPLRDEYFQTDVPRSGIHLHGIDVRGEHY